MTLDVHPAGIPANRPYPERPTDPRPAWERVAYTWLAREVDQGQPVDPASLAREVSVAPDLARDLLRLLRAQHDSPWGLEVLSEPVSHCRPTPSSSRACRRTSPQAATSPPR